MLLVAGWAIPKQYQREEPERRCADTADENQLSSPYYTTGLVKFDVNCQTNLLEMSSLHTVHTKSIHQH